MSGERERLGLMWLERLRAAAAAKQPLVEYCRRHGLRPGEAYQWKKNLRRSGRWPADTQRRAESSAEKPTPPGFARVVIEPTARTVSHPLHLQVHLRNGRRAELTLSDEGQLYRVLELIETLP